MLKVILIILITKNIYQIQLTSYVDRVIEKKYRSRPYYRDVKFRDNEFIIKYLNGTKKILPTENLSNLISKMTLFNTRAILIKNKYNFYKILELKNERFSKWSVYKIFWYKYKN